MGTAPLDLVTTRWSSTNAEDRFPVDNPATGEVFAMVQGGGAAEVDAAVRSAHAAFLGWRRVPARERGLALLQASRKLAEHADELSELLCRENGKPVRDAKAFDVSALIHAFAYFGSLADKMSGETLDMGNVYSVTVREPYGVVAGIIPFNWPPIHTGAKIAPALAAGNTIVLKPGEQAPLTIMRIVEIINTVLPPDLVHVVPGPGATGRALTAHPLIRKISFTGAPSTGTAVLKAAAERHVPVLLELGGKNPFIVFEDADLDRAVRDAVDAAFFNKGEACTAGSRILVHADIHDAFAERFAAFVRRLRLGEGTDPKVHVGPLISKPQQQKVLDYIRIGLEEGATILAQAPLPQEERLRNGYFVQPTVFTGVAPHMRIAQEEIFGPVTALMAFRTEEEAIAIANSTDFALVAGIYSRDQARANRVARGVEAGIVFINNYNRGGNGTPFGGTKSSGYGRERAAMTLNEFTYVKALRIPTGFGDVPQWSALDDIAETH
ncbi:acyl-CoA reductase-like NAD-dependent aldehyde dehydrogenase [Xanthobacter flavus]|uniref:Aldehyde dehydrogenase n=1 Tax=Xanthobacter flavus TaxID=281 RepID=A0A9W6CRA6_XANFL|nr:aldehyde dehydrogenase family protein [Xanthobacter flavus]MDR6335509.1 acyl-CoA reductase-like NAD-dependent aldehyde dehydrogenase [Xanthobacter flavus]GLI23934.1 aldehyde dehydrogenase [Xanthobacter flavus]